MHSRRLHRRHRALLPLTAYYAMRTGTCPGSRTTRPGDSRLEPLAERTARTHHAVLLANHGPVVAGATLLLQGQRRTRPLTPEQAALTSKDTP
ncbi:class II aldolase/adducin family protein [Streptomyces sp. NPDC055189]